MKTALVGGANRGLGFACAEALSKKGHKVILCARDETQLVLAAERIEQSSGLRPSIIPCDFSSHAALEQLKSRLLGQGFRIDILVNNVGGPSTGRATEVSEQQWQEGLDLLFWSTIRLYNIVLPGMRQNHWGRIINILSTTVREPVSQLAISSVFRAALASYAKLVAQEVAQDGITVNSIMPAGFLTERTKILHLEEAKQKRTTLEVIQEEFTAQIPMKRMLLPNELGALVAFLASEESSGLTGALIPVDGGYLKAL